MFKCQFSVMIWIGSFGAKPHMSIIFLVIGQKTYLLNTMFA